MNFLRCLYRRSSFRYWTALSFPHVETKLNCTLAFLNTPVSRSFTRCLYDFDGPARTLPRPSSCGLQSFPVISTQKSRHCSHNSTGSAESTGQNSLSDMCDPSESSHEEEKDSSEETEVIENKTVRTFGSNEYEFDSNGYMPVDQLVKFLQNESALDICVIKTSGARKAYVDYFVVVSGVSRRHMNAMAKNLEKLFRGLIVRAIGKDGHVTVEGLGSDDWLVLDIGNMVVHFFLSEARSGFELEKLWTLGPEYDDQYKELLTRQKFLDAVFVGEETGDQEEEL